MPKVVERLSPCLCRLSAFVEVRPQDLWTLVSGFFELLVLLDTGPWYCSESVVLKVCNIYALPRSFSWNLGFRYAEVQKDGLEGLGHCTSLLSRLGC